MLRLAVLILLLANAAYFAWSQGLLRAWGLAPAVQTEPQRLNQQIRPDAVRVLNPKESKELEAATAKPPECLQAGLFDERQVERLQKALAGVLPSSAWSFEPVQVAGRWIVYMGPYPNAEALNKKRAELRQRNVLMEDLRNSALEPGISLGGFDDEATANKSLSALAQRGVRTARVMKEREPEQGQRLRLPAVDPVQRTKLDEIAAEFAGKSLQVCS